MFREKVCVYEETIWVARLRFCDTSPEAFNTLVESWNRLTDEQQRGFIEELREMAVNMIENPDFHLMDPDKRARLREWLTIAPDLITIRGYAGIDDICS